ncbi:MAG: alcohol dehydrogenase catalytic domain-containing protein [Flavobacteriales bacterium]|nr:alcohol dehydrogenase catalytic domain-containing protein [Flavobacteriales bacterium]
MSETMKVMATDGYGPIERLSLMSIPLPEPGKSEVRVRVHASAINPADFKVITGSMKFLHARNRPLVVGYDFSGVIDKVGPEVTSSSWARPCSVFYPMVLSTSKAHSPKRSSRVRIGSRRNPLR